MTTAELAHVAATHLARMLSRQNVDAWYADQSVVDIAEPIIAGAIRRGIEEAERARLELGGAARRSS